MPHTVGTLAIACWKDDDNLFRHLLATRSDLNDREGMATHGAMALFYAVYRRNKTIVLELLKRRADVNALVYHGYTSLFAAIYSHSADMLELLVSKGGDVNVVARKETLLSTAALVSSLECVQFLLPIDTRRASRDTACTSSAARNVDILSAVLEHHLPSPGSVTAQCLYNASSNAAAVEMLLSRCWTTPDLTATVNRAFKSILTRGANRDVIEVFLTHGVDVSCLSAAIHESPLFKTIGCLSSTDLTESWNNCSKTDVLAIGATTRPRRSLLTWRRR